MGMRETGTQGKQEASKADAGRRCLLILIDLVCLQPTGPIRRVEDKCRRVE